MCEVVDVTGRRHLLIGSLLPHEFPHLRAPLFSAVTILYHFSRLTIPRAAVSAFARTVLCKSVYSPVIVCESVAQPVRNEVARGSSLSHALATMGSNLSHVSSLSLSVRSLSPMASSPSLSLSLFASLYLLLGIVSRRLLSPSNTSITSQQ